MKHKLGICIPYRNRFEHLKKLIEVLSPYLEKKKIDHKFYVAHQVDEKLFNRGLMKNIAAKYAFDDGCDYIAWHDVDMIPVDDSCDYSYPEETPIHIATNLSKYDYILNYEQYFGGVVLFTRDHVEKTNGYSNQYWDWGMEDDDLFFRCHFEGYTNFRIYKKYEDVSVARFDGNSSYIEIPWSSEINKILGSDHTISVLFKPQQQPEKYGEWLIGSGNKKFIEFPVFRKQSEFPYCISYNNSRAVTGMLFDAKGKTIYNWIKRDEEMWTWATLSYDKNFKKFNFFMNDELGKSNEKGIKERSSIEIPYGIRQFQDKSPCFLGYNDDKYDPIYFKGEIAELMLFNSSVKSEDDVSNFQGGSKIPYLHIKFEDVERSNLKLNNIEIVKASFDVNDIPIPYRREGKFDCLPHIDEGLVNDRWVKGETTARNERRFVTQMQKGSLNYKEEGFNSMQYEVISVKEVFQNTLLINCKV